MSDVVRVTWIFGTGDRYAARQAADDSGPAEEAEVAARRSELRRDESASLRIGRTSGPMREILCLRAVCIRKGKNANGTHTQNRIVNTRAEMVKYAKTSFPTEYSSKTVKFRLPIVQHRIVATYRRWWYIS